VAQSIAAADSNRTIYHLHWLVPDRLRHEERLHIETERKLRDTSYRRQSRPRYVWQGQYLSRQVAALPSTGDKWKVITMIRDPVARNVSAFFENLELFGFDYRSRLQSDSIDAIMPDLERLFREQYVDGSGATRVDSDPLTWFDEELKTVFDVDVFKRAFPVQQGFAIYHAPKAEILMMRLKDLNQHAGAAFKRFLGIETQLQPRDNVAAEKDYAPLYQRFLETFEMPESYLDQMYTSKVSQHFYTDEELERFRSRWKHQPA
jgi:hypothetical protein